MENTSTRNAAIDIFRGLTMALMVFVNDFWTVRGVPHALEHFGTWEDGMGLSDIIFPMFLFAMGMSIPYAIDRREAKGYSFRSTVLHIFNRTLALLLMGAFIVNTEGVTLAPLVPYGKGVYWLLMLAGFFLVWNQYPRDFKWKKACRTAGIAVLAFLVITYRTDDGQLFRGSWWGILGQIGWMYLFASLAYLLCREKKWIPAVFWFVFCLVNLSVAPMRDRTTLLGPNLFSDFSGALQLGNGHSIIMALGGVLTVLGERLLNRKEGLEEWKKILSGLAVALVLAGLAVLVHKWWIVSKNVGTLPWCLYVSAISVALYTLLRVLERHGLAGWGRVLGPAGTATLTVYMMPYFYYSFWVFLSPEIPMWLSGGAGIVKCALFSCLCIATAWAIGKAGLKLKI